MNTIAVTGAEGFIGIASRRSSRARGYSVRAMVHYNSFSSAGWLDAMPPAVLDHVEIGLGDVRDHRSVMDLIEGVDAVCHLAALIAIPYSYRAPESYLATNAGRNAQHPRSRTVQHTPRVIHTSTSEVYGTARSVPISETHPLQAQSPYAASKIAADKLAESYTSVSTFPS